MKITSVKIHKIEKENSNKKGTASVLLDDCFVVHGIKILEGESGLYIVMPKRPTSSGLWIDVAHPINSETRALFEKAILEAYESAE